jgi:1-acyl-sn-glycerol-3-phosphate acyltransferase
MKLFYRFAWTIVRVYTTIFCKLKLVGIENIPKSEGVIVASNHISWFDPPILGSSINRPLFFMAKKE